MTPTDRVKQATVAIGEQRGMFVRADFAMGLAREMEALDEALDNALREVGLWQTRHESAERELALLRDELAVAKQYRCACQSARTGEDGQAGLV